MWILLEGKIREIRTAPQGDAAGERTRGFLESHL